MPFTNFPGGITSFGVPQIGPGQGLPLTAGNYWFVQSTGPQGDGTSSSSPVASVNTAMAKASANDVIICLPGHAETITSSTAMKWNVAGIAIVGCGNGAARPTFTISTANTATIAVSAANVSVSNCIFVANFLSIAACFTLTTAKNFTVNGCLFLETSGVLDFLNIIKSTGAANTVDGLTVLNSQWAGQGTTSVNTFILSANDIDRLTVMNNAVQLANTTDQAIFVVITAGVLTNADIGGNTGYRASTTSVNGTIVNVGGTTSTGWVYGNFIQTLGSGDTIGVGTTGLSAFQNFISDALGASGFLRPAADT